MIQVNRLCAGYGTRTVLQDISFSIPCGSLVAVLGMNGSGKSTLLRCLARLLRPSNGTIQLNQQNLSHISLQQAARTIAYLPQNAPPLDCSVIEAVLIGRKPHLNWQVQSQDLQETNRILELTGLVQYADRLTSRLSGGELQRVAIARTLAQQPRLLLLDEPVNHLDIRSQLDIMALLRRLTHQLGIITIAVMHDINLALRFCDTFLLLREGQLAASGGPEVVTAPAINEVYQLQVLLHTVGDLTVVVPRPDQEPSKAGVRSAQAPPAPHRQDRYGELLFPARGH